MRKVDVYPTRSLRDKWRTFCIPTKHKDFCICFKVCLLETQSYIKLQTLKPGNHVFVDVFIGQGSGDRHLAYCGHCTGTFSCGALSTYGKPCRRKCQKYIQSLTLEFKAAYNVFFSDLSAIPGPIPAKFLSAYLQPALIRGERAQVSLPSIVGDRSLACKLTTE